ncbi:MAG: phosphoribosylformylglycinamidine synthase subunit PurS, partial [Planctomycetota bacterium]|nr:phosphoribosylformylglycinamidine synthase subunit PurS [Planctomycetota bacterium]
MKQWRFEVFNRRGFSDVRAKSVLEDIRELGIRSVEAVQSAKVFLIGSDFNKDFAERVAKELLIDPICEEYYIGRSGPPAGLAKATLIEVHLKSGVTDPVAESVMTAVADMGVKANTVRTARKYVLLGDITPKQTDTIAKKILANDCIEVVLIGNESEPPSPHLKPYELKIVHWPIRDLDGNGLIKLSKEKDLFLNLVEMQTIQKYYRQLGREPTDVELETLAQTWSEHCVHKTLKSSVDISIDGRQIHFDNLLKETVFKATKELNKKWCISVFSDNAGVVEFDEDSA